MKKRWIATSLTLLAMTVGNPAQAEELHPLRTITVTGMSERKVVPDEAHMTVNLNAMDLKLATAKAAHDAKLKKLMALVKNAGIPENKVRTQSSNVQPIYSYDNTNGSHRRFDGYRVQTELDITVTDTAKLGVLMEQVMNAGFEQGATTEWGNLVSTYYTLSDPDKIRDDMLVAAIANAKDKATRMAGAVGASIVRVYQMSEGNAPAFNPRPMPMMAMARGGATDAAAIAPPPGEEQINATVTVTFELKD